MNEAKISSLKIQNSKCHLPLSLSGRLRARKFVLFNQTKSNRFKHTINVTKNNIGNLVEYEFY